MEVGAGPGIGDAGDLGQGPEHDGTESESGGMVGAGPGIGDAMSQEAFAKAVKDALGKTREQQEQEMDAAYYSGTVDESQFDDPSNTNPALDPEAFREKERALMGPTLDNLDTTVDESVAKSMVGYIDQDVRDQTEAQHERELAQKAIDNKINFRKEEARRMQGLLDIDPDDVTPDVPKGARGYEVVTETENMALPYNQMDEQERKAFWGNLNRTRQAIRDRQTPLGKALHTAFSFALGMSKVSTIGKAVKAALDKIGFNVNPNEVEQAARHAFEVSTQGPEGPGGTSVGSRNDSFIENFFDNLPASSYDEPWMKGLNERQIQYYLDRPSELEWVRNLYNQMNPMSPVFVTPTN